MVPVINIILKILRRVDAISKFIDLGRAEGRFYGQYGVEIFDTAILESAIQALPLPLQMTEGRVKRLRVILNKNLAWVVTRRFIEKDLEIRVEIDGIELKFKPVDKDTFLERVIRNQGNTSKMEDVTKLAREAFEKLFLQRLHSTVYSTGDEQDKESTFIARLSTLLTKRGTFDVKNIGITIADPSENYLKEQLNFKMNRILVGPVESVKREISNDLTPTKVETKVRHDIDLDVSVYLGDHEDKQKLMRPRSNSWSDPRIKRKRKGRCSKTFAAMQASQQWHIGHGPKKRILTISQDVAIDASERAIFPISQQKMLLVHRLCCILVGKEKSGKQMPEKEVLIRPFSFTSVISRKWRSIVKREC